jgi:hypothetical protein
MCPTFFVYILFAHFSYRSHAAMQGVDYPGVTLVVQVR